MASPSFMEACASASVLLLIAAASSPSFTVLSSWSALSIAPFSAAETLSPYSLRLFSVVWMSASAWLRASTSSRRFLSSAECASASLTMRWMSASERPPEAWMRMVCSLPVALSLAETLTMPLASMSKVTSICGTPRGAEGMPMRSNWPSSLLSAAISRSPWKTRIVTVTIRVFQGEREMAADNKLLGQFDLMGIPSAPRGVPQIEVTFDIDANGIVNVSAKDKATGKEQTIRIQASGGLSEADIQRMVKEAEAHSAEDKKRRELVEARNQADALIHTTEKSLKEYGDKVSAAEKGAIESALQELKTVKDGEDAAAIKSKTEALAQASMKLGEAMYKSSQEAAAGGGASAGAAEPNAGGGRGTSGAGGANEKVVDADFEEVDDEKNKKSA